MGQFNSLDERDQWQTLEQTGLRTCKPWRSSIGHVSVRNPSLRGLTMGRMIRRMCRYYVIGDLSLLKRLLSVEYNLWYNWQLLSAMTTAR